MASSFIIYSERRQRLERNMRLAALLMIGLALVLFSASCVDTGSSLRQASARPAPADPAATAFDPTELAPISSEEAYAANAALPLSALPDGGAAPLSLQAVTAVDQMRSLDCLAQAIYYEARSESEDGQRAVAQVVLNRMRHPAYPASVCGVVYQGPMRAGGGCQFTFTCDGSVFRAPSGPNWLRARELAAEALSGYVHASVGHATHYHTHAVFPAWAPKLVKAALIGNHIFYRLPGANGSSGAFSQAYAGREPVPVPTQIFFLRSPQRKGALGYQMASLTLPAGLPDTLPQVRPTEQGLPESTIREEYRHTGRIKAMPAPAEDVSQLD